MRARTTSKRTGGHLLPVGIGLALAAVSVVAVVIITGSRTSDTVSTPQGAVTQAAVAAGVQVAVPSVNLGRVPLDTPVKHAFVLQNRGAEAAALGQARIEVLEGC